MSTRPEPAPGGHYRGVSDDGLIRRLRVLGLTPIQLRTWATENGIPVPAVGVIDEPVIAAYEQAHPQQEDTPCPTSPSRTTKRAATSTSKTPKPSPAPANPIPTPGTETASATPGPAPTPTTSTSSTTPTAPSPTPTTTDAQQPTTATPSSADDEHARLTAAGVSPATANVLARLVDRSRLHPVDVYAAAGYPDSALRQARARRLGVRGLPIARLRHVVDTYDDLFANTTDPLLAALDAARAELDQLTRRTA